MTVRFTKHRFYRGTAFCALERELCFLYGSAVIGAIGAVGTVKGMGIYSVTRTGTGVYEIQLDQLYSRYLSGKVGFIHATGGSGIATVEIAYNPANFQPDFKAGAKITIKCLDFTGAAADPASGSVMGIEAIVRNSSAGPADA